MSAMLCPECPANPDLLRPLHDRVGDDTVDADHGQQQSRTRSVFLDDPAYDAL